MQLYKLLQDFEYSIEGNIAEQVDSLSHNSKEENIKSGRTLRQGICGAESTSETADY